MSSRVSEQRRKCSLACIPTAEVPLLPVDTSILPKLKIRLHKLSWSANSWIHVEVPTHRAQRGHAKTEFYAGIDTNVGSSLGGGTHSERVNLTSSAELKLPPSADEDTRDTCPSNMASESRRTLQGPVRVRSADDDDDSSGLQQDAVTRTAPTAGPYKEW
ncbi:hypothetical protein JOM56_004784 [Amanita muscaria]